MISDWAIPELKAYRQGESRLPLVNRFDLADLVAPTLNDTLPVHRWYRFKESFSPQIVQEVLTSLEGDLGTEFRLLDPFCGVGTTLVAAQELARFGTRVHSIGIEHNPFVRFVARTKCRWPQMNRKRILAEGERAVSRITTGVTIPVLSSIRRSRCITRYLAARVCELREAIGRVADGADRGALLLGLASAIEPLSRTRKDGRALRIVDRPPTRFLPAVRSRWELIAEDLAEVRDFVNDVPRARVLSGDGRKPRTVGVERGSIDVIVTSPPYPNNIDYSEVYKLELWLLQYVVSRDQFFDLRRRTFRSHPTALGSAPSNEFLRLIQSGRLHDLFWPLVERTTGMDDAWRARLLVGYFEDLWLSLREYNAVLRDGGYAVFVVGNSLHGGKQSPYVIPTDLILAELGRRTGFAVEELSVARGSKRRLSGNHFLRETVVILRKNAKI